MTNADLARWIPRLWLVALLALVLALWSLIMAWITRV